MISFLSQNSSKPKNNRSVIEKFDESLLRFNPIVLICHRMVSFKTKNSHTTDKHNTKRFYQSMA